MTDPTEQTIIERILSGDVQAYTTLVNRYKDMAVVLAYNILLNREDAEEAAQDAFVRIYNSLHTFRAASRFSTWLYRIVLNTALNKKRIRKHYFKEFTYQDDELPAELNRALAAAVTADQRKQIGLAMRALSEKERICITLFYLNELSVEEIGMLTGISRSSIKVLLHRGRKNLYTSINLHFKGEILI